MILEWIHTGALGLMLAASVFSAPAAEQSEPTVLESYGLTTGRGTITVEETAQNGAALSAKERRYALYNGDAVLFGRTEAAYDLEEVCVASLELEGSYGTVHWYDAAQERWEVAGLSQTEEIEAGCVFVSTENGEVLLYTPKVFEPLENATLRREPELAGSVQISVEEGHVQIRLVSEEIPAGFLADYALVQSDEALLRWKSDEEQEAWKRCTMDNDRLWGYDGCYHPSPPNYVPTGEDCYYRIPASYFTRLVAENAPEIRAAEDLTAAMLDVLTKQQNQAGYFPTLPECEWLSDDYGIGGGFYDTRFNSDLAEIFSSASWLDCTEHKAVMDRYFDFYTAYALTRSTPTEHGLLVWDYYETVHGGSRTHTALNHQAAEAMALYHWAEVSGRTDLCELADKLVAGIEDTAENWICEDGELHYAVYADGSYGGQDYPYLTYNDLFALRSYLQEKGREAPGIQRLMDAKLGWMQANGVEGYRQ